MKRIPLTQGKFALVDDEDYEYLNQFKWFASKANKREAYYALRNDYTVNPSKQLWMHRIIMKPTGKMIIDHINGDGLDNRRKNLRICTRRQNAFNRGSGKGSASKYLGVSWYTYLKKWRSAIRVNGNSRHLGYFKTELEAAIISNIAMRKHYGEFARPNKLTKIRYKQDV